MYGSGDEPCSLDAPTRVDNAHLCACRGVVSSIGNWEYNVVHPRCKVSIRSLILFLPPFPPRCAQRQSTWRTSGE